MKLSKQDATVTVVILLLILLLGWGYSRALRLSQGKGNPIGRVFFYKKTATRKKNNQALWLKLKDGVPVYHRDVLRTTTGSEAVIVFTDNSRLDIAENTMVRISHTGMKKKDVRLVTGAIRYARAAGNPAAHTVHVGKTTISLSGDGQVNVRGGERDSTVEIARGEALLHDAQGQTLPLQTFTQLATSREDGTVRILHPTFVPLLPDQDALLLTAEHTRSVGFVWLGDATTVQPSVRLQISRYADFSVIETERKLTLPHEANASRTTFKTSERLGEGRWFWRLVPQNGTASAPRSFSVRRARKVMLHTPRAQAVLSYRDAIPPTLFSWTSVEDVEQYRLLLSSRADFSADVKTFSLRTPEISVPGLGEGTYFWKVVPSFDEGIEDPVFASEVGTFSIKQGKELHAPVALFPAEDEVLEHADRENRMVIFTCEPIPEARRYVWTVKNMDANASPLVTTTSVPFLTVPMRSLRARLQEGTYQWQVAWETRRSDRSPYSALRAFTVIEGMHAWEEEPETRDLIALRAPSFVLRDMPALITEKYLLQHRALRCKWTAVHNAQRYTVTLKNKKTDAVLQTATTTGVEFSFTNLAHLEEGSFHWVIQAHTEQEGYEPASAQVVRAFTIRVSELERPRAKEIVHYEYH